MKARVLPILSGVILLAGCKPPSADLAKAIHDLGFADLTPPRNSVSPGTIVSIIQSNPTLVKIICPQADALGPGVTITNSPTVSETWTDKTKSSFALDASYTDAVNAKLGANSVKDISFQLSSASELEMAADEVDKALAGHTPLPACVSAVKRAVGNGEKVTMLYATLKADVVYSINYDQSVTAAAKAQITKDIAAQLDAQAEQTGSDTIKGTALIWGVMDDQTMIDAFLGNPKVGGQVRANALIPKARVHLLGAAPVKVQAAEIAK